MVRRVRLVLAFGFAVIACASQQGDGEGEDEDEVPDSCGTQTTILAPDEPSVTGVTPAQILADAEGIYVGGIYFQQHDEFPSHPLAGQDVPLTFEIRYEGGEIRDNDAIPLQPDAWMYGCADSLEIDVQLHAVSEDGSVDEAMEVALLYEPESLTHTAGRPVLRFSYDPDELPGGLQQADFELPAGAVFVELEFSAVAHGGGLDGSFSIHYDTGAPTIPTFANVAAVRELTDAACGQIQACWLAGCASTEAREVLVAADGCWCVDPITMCVANPGDGPATELWAHEGSMGVEGGSQQTVMALGNVLEPLDDPWVPCSELPENEECSCFMGLNACPQ